MRYLLSPMILIFILMFSILSVFAEVITIGSGTSYTSNYEPWGSFYGYQRSDQIYLKTELGGTGTITTYAIKPQITKATANIPIKIYMKNTTATTCAIATTTWNTRISGATLVYTGTINSLTANIWQTVTLATPFPYTDNLEILTESNYGGGGNSPYPTYYYTTTTNCNWFYRKDITAPTGSETTGTRNNNRSNIQLSISDYHSILTPSSAVLVSPADYATGQALTPSLTWTAGAGYSPNGYKLYYGTDGAGTTRPTTLVNGDDLGDLLNYTASNTLSANTTYYWCIVPYNTYGDALATPIWRFTTEAFLAGPVTTPNPLDTAINVSTATTISWAAYSGATSYDVYFAKTSDGLPGIPTVNVTSTTWLPPTMLNDTNYSWKVIARNSIGEQINAGTIWTFTTVDAFHYAASYPTHSEDDDIGQFILGSFANPSAEPTPLLNNPDATGTYTDNTLLTINVSPEQVYPVSILQFNSGQFYSCWVKVFIDYNQNYVFDMPEEQVFSSATSSTVNPVSGTITIPNGYLGTTRLRVVLRESGTETTTIPTGSYSWGETEDYTLNIVEIPPEIVYPAIADSPLDLATDAGITQTFSWHPNLTYGVPSGYLLSFGTDNPPTSLQYQKDLGNVTTYTPEIGNLAYGTHYYWQIIPYNQNGNAQDCPVWSFTTMSDPTITSFPYYQGFEDTAFPPAGWLNIKTLGIDTPGTWLQTSAGLNPACSPHSGDKMAYFNCWNYQSGSKGILVTPPLNLNAENYYVSFWLYRSASELYGTCQDLVNIYYNTSADLNDTPVLLYTVHRDITQTPIVSSVGWYFYRLNLPEGAMGNGRFIVFEGISDWGENMFLDDIMIEQAPPPEPPFTLNKGFLGMPVVSIGGTASDSFTISAWYGSCVGTISYSEGLSGPTTFTATPDTTVEVTFDPSVQGLYSGTVTVSASGYSREITVSGNAGITAIDWETVPSGWNVYDLDANGFTWAWYTGAAHSGSYSVGDYYNPSGNNDWLISPWYAIATGDKITFFAKSQDPEWPEAMQVLVSSTGNTPSNFSTVLLNIPVVPELYTGYEIDLSTYVGQTVSFAFYDNAVNSWYLLVDDMGLPGLALPAVPLNLEAISTSSGVQLNWDNVPGSTSYRIYSASDPNLSPELWTLLSESTTNSYLDEAIATKRFYHVIAVNGNKSTNNIEHDRAIKIPFNEKPSLKRN